jgi:hypothetical protein
MAINFQSKQHQHEYQSTATIGIIKEDDFKSPKNIQHHKADKEKKEFSNNKFSFSSPGSNRGSKCTLLVNENVLTRSFSPSTKDDSDLTNVSVKESLAQNND